MRSVICTILRTTAQSSATTSLTLALLGSAAVAAGEGDEKARASETGAYRALAHRAAPGVPKIDGRLDDPAWQLAAPITGFVQRDPDEGEGATERTEARVLFDDDALYVGIRAHDSEPMKIVGQLTRRDAWSPSDWLIVSIDSYYDRRTAFEFAVNPAGVERDRYLFNDTDGDRSWNAVWDVATRVDEQGWVAEFRIPFSQLRFSKVPEQVWGFNIERVIQRKNEVDQWKPIAKDASGWVSEYGELVGIDGIEPPRRLEILPYAVAQSTRAPAQDGNPFRDGSDYYGTAGADVRYGLTNSLTLNLTINPDFGQIEADPSVVNLSAFETFFAERRPFFLEGANIFQYGLNGGGGAEGLFYSRRVGRRPQGFADPRGGHVDMPISTTILEAVKLSGKTADGWSVGVLDAVTAKEKALVIDGGGLRHEDVVEPLTNYGLVRVQRDFRGGRSALGGIFTAVNRSGLPANLRFLRTSAYAAGIDGRTRFRDGDWEVTGQLIGSVVSGSPDAIGRTQKSSARYFQRPDADHLEFDPNATRLVGSSGLFSFAKIGGGHWRGDIRTGWISPGFEVNDLGFQRQADLWRSSAWIGYVEFEPGAVVRRYGLNWNAWNWQTFGGERTATGSNLNGSFTLLNYWGGFAGINREFPATTTRVLRGGPSMKQPGAWNWWMGFFSDDRKPVSADAGTWRWSDDERSDAGGYWASLTWRPRGNLRLALGPQYDWAHRDWQYVTTTEALGGEQYVMGVLEQNTISLTTRLDWTFTPDLSLQLYAQPFISAGDYTAFTRVIDPQAHAYDRRFDRFGADRLSFEPAAAGGAPGTYHVDLDGDGATDLSFVDPNFNFKQLRSTFVLRWEYRPGSTLFFVWSGSRTAFEPTGEFDPIDDFGRLLDADGENVFSIKLSYYLTP